jgi:hypothetical protein
MSDYIESLRTDLVEAAARHQRRGAVARTVVPLRPRAWSRPALSAVAVTAACLAAVLVAVSAIGPPAPRPTHPRIVVSAKVAGIASDAMLSGGDLWVTDFNGGLVRVDPATGRVLARTPLGGAARTIGAGMGRLWVIADAKRRPVVVQIDPRTARVLDRHEVHPSALSIFTVDAGGLWLPGRTGPMERVSAPGRAPTAHLRLGFDGYTVGVLATPTTLWVVANDGTLLQADVVSGRVVQSLRRAVAGTHGNGGDDLPENGLAADASGVWAVDQDREEVVRFSGGRIVQRIRAGGHPGPVALSHGSLWLSVTDPQRRRYRVVRFDASSGRVTGSVGVGFHVPKALVPSSHGLWVVGSDGTALLVR